MKTKCSLITQGVNAKDLKHEKRAFSFLPSFMTRMIFCQQTINRFLICFFAVDMSRKILFLSENVR